MYGLFGPEGLEAPRAAGAAKKAGGWGGGGMGIGSYGGLGGLGWTLFNMQRAWRWTGGALMGWEEQYAGAEMGMQRAAFQGGTGSITPQGAPLELMGRQAQASLAQYNWGRPPTRTGAA